MAQTKRIDHDTSPTVIGQNRSGTKVFIHGGDIAAKPGEVTPLQHGASLKIHDTVEHTPGENIMHREAGNANTPATPIPGGGGLPNTRVVMRSPGEFRPAGGAPNQFGTRLEVHAPPKPEGDPLVVPPEPPAALPVESEEARKVREQAEQDRADLELGRKMREEQMRAAQAAQPLPSPEPIKTGPGTGFMDAAAHEKMVEENRAAELKRREALEAGHPVTVAAPSNPVVPPKAI